MPSEPRLPLLYHRRSQWAEVLVFASDWLISIGNSSVLSSAYP